ncbi:MAG: peroxide stress protein YaaA [Kordia sp.]|uniref:peroxide stress protein YaaA n=1 Tax=Kordia sp. TaxID=1965332 RepID=UPI00385F798F
MKIVISPAKSLDLESSIPTEKHTEACFLKEAAQLSKVLKKKSRKELSSLMKISDALADLNYQRNQEWELPFNIENARPSIYTFSGQVFQGLDAFTLPEEKIDTLQSTLRILSGQYGLLKPLDLMQPYRLEMGTRLPVGKNKNLYEFWKKKITTALNNELAADELFVNLASNEYYKAVDAKALKVPVITPTFKDFKNGEYKVIMTYAKLARGYMTRYLIDADVKTIDDLKGFNYEGYGFSEELSNGNELVFTR